jgi:hypothetical protein
MKDEFICISKFCLKIGEDSYHSFLTIVESYFYSFYIININDYIESELDALFYFGRKIKNSQ